MKSNSSLDSHLWLPVTSNGNKVNTQTKNMETVAGSEAAWPSG